MSNLESNPPGESEFQLENAFIQDIKATFPYDALSEVLYCTSSLGQLMMIAWSTKDITINFPPATKGFKYIDYPDSLRATLQQIVNAGYNALESAHLKMININFYSFNKMCGMPKLLDNIQAAVDPNTATQYRQRILILKRNLEELKSAAEYCQGEACGALKSFSDLKDLMEEVQLALNMANTSSERNQQKQEKKRKELEIQQKFALEKIQQQEKDVESRSQHLRETEKALRKAIKKLPGNLKVLAMKALDMCLDTFKTVSSNMTFGIADAVEYILFQIKGKIPKEDSLDKDIAESLFKFKIEMAEHINTKAELKLQQAKEEREETIRQYTYLTTLSAQLISQPQNEISVGEILKSGIQLTGKLITNLGAIDHFLNKLNIITQQTQNQIPNLTDLPEENPEHEVIGFGVIDLPWNVDRIRIEFLKSSCMAIGYFSHLYIKQSEEHIMPRIGELSQYAAISPSNIAAIRQNLIDSTATADQKINVAVQENWSELFRKINESKK